MDSPQSNQARWFAEEVEPHEPSLRAYLRTTFPKVRDLDDVVQSSYLKVWRQHATTPIRSARSFLFTVAKRLALDVLRHERRSPIDRLANLGALEVADSEGSARVAASRAERVRLLIEAVDSLPARCREVVILRKFKFVPQREVAARLGISEKGVENQLARGIARCREYFRRRGVQDYFVDEV